MAIKIKRLKHGIKVGDVMAMIHTGSRDVGFYVGNRWVDRAKQAYPKNMKHPDNKIFALEGELAQEYLIAMQTASHYATTNRALISEIVRQRAIQVFGKDSNHLITDVPHNIVIKALSHDDNLSRQVIDLPHFAYFCLLNAQHRSGEANQYRDLNSRLQYRVPTEIAMRLRG